MDTRVVGILNELDALLEDPDGPQPPSPSVNTLNALQQWFPTNPLLWNACKHLIASAQGAKCDELEKALWYLQQEIKRCKPSTSS